MAASPSPVPRKATPASVQKPLRAPEKPLTAPETGAPRKKVLVVDDDPVTVRALSLKLESKGYSVVTASDGSQALNATRKERPDVMLLDVHFPPDVAHGGGVPWNGFLITQWLRRLGDARNTPVIFISANDRVEYRQRASDADAVAFLPKPIDNDVLLASIETALFRKTDGAPGKTMEAGGQKPEARNQNSEDNSRRVRIPLQSENERVHNSVFGFGL